MAISKKLETIYHNGQPDGICSIRRNAPHTGHVDRTVGNPYANDPHAVAPQRSVDQNSQNRAEKGRGVN